MSFISSIIQIVSCLCGPITSLRENVDSLKRAMDELKSMRNDVERKVNEAKQRLLKCKDHVEWWLKEVEEAESEVTKMERDFQQMTRYLGNCSTNCWSDYKLSKRVENKLKEVDDLKTKGASFNVVAETTLPDPVEEQPSTSALGMDLMLKRIQDWLSEDSVGVVGIYGMGGVGKTTLLKKINNELLKTTHGFDVVIWVVVSKEVNVGRIKKHIRERLHLSCDQEEKSNEERPATDIKKALSGKKFMLLLDDVWKRLDLQVIGIPHQRSLNSKIIFTTRYENVCDHMYADRKVKVECLPDQEAMHLFRQNVGEETMNSHSEIPILAKSVAKECSGLPLALITIGRAMACKKTPQEWEHAISVLSTSEPPSGISGMDDDMLLRLKFSYDNLDGDTIKSCFLYCALFPEDYSIRKEELIDYWIGEGFFDGWDDDLDQARNKGHDIIGRLKVACLLESGSDEKAEVKLHDVIRDLALWIASECGKRKKRYLVKAGVGLRQAPEVEKWEEAERISLMNNNIKEVTETPQCLNLLTLMLQRNYYLKKVHTEFFQFMPLLRVLDLSNNPFLDELPAAIGNLAELQYLNLSSTNIRSLPEEMGKLVKLKHLDLENTKHLGIIPQGAISSLSQLRVMNLFDSNYSKWEEGSEGINMSELEGLERLTHLGISVQNVQAFEKLIGSSKLRKVTRDLNLRRFEGLTTSTQLSYLFRVMRRISIKKCNMLEEVTIGADGERDDNYPASSLRWLRLDDLSILNCIRFGRRCFKSLHSIYIWNCVKLQKIYGLHQLESLETIEIDSCQVLEEVISRTVDNDQVGNKGLMQLKYIFLHKIPKLMSICSYALDFPSLEAIHVVGCPELKKLPLSLSSGQNSVKEIRGEKEWWDGLNWEENSKSSFQPVFRAW